MPSAERIEINEAGHLLPYERPDPFVAAVVGFLAQRGDRLGFASARR